MVEHGHEDWMGNDHLTKVHEETLGNGAKIHVTARQTADQEYLIEMRVYGSDGQVLHEEVKKKVEDPGPTAELLKWGIDQAKRHAAGHRGAPMDNHHQKTPI
ncbi:hypothetical protein [Pseudomonas sp. NPDC007930]|uniref:hypothetical protein n=1 Tax=Pseudomonas sp. NPDC007930 TaxID=3364417 RepID=UPI0036E07730